VIDLRNIGLIGAIELAPRPGQPNARAFEAFLECFKRGLLVRVTGDTIALSPPLIVEKPEIDRMAETLRSVLASIS
jgi:beta-alanine--pyruvate transaminase